MPDILHFLKIQAPVELVYRALTTSDGVRNWWTRDVDLGSEVGSIGEFRFYGGAHVTTLEVEELIPSSRVVWKTLSSFRPEWEGTKISFDLRQEGDLVVLLFAHRDFETADEAFAMFSTGWAYYLVSLQQYLQSGQGAPSPDVDFGRMLR